MTAFDWRPFLETWSHELIEAGHEPPPPANAPSELWTADTRHPTLLAALTMEREALYRRVEARISEREILAVT